MEPLEPEKPQYNVKAIINQLVNTDVLVELVKDRPVIWDNTVEGYRNRDITIPAWEEVFRTFFPPYNDWHEEQKTFVAKLVKQKWVTARDIWQRLHKKRNEAMQNGGNVSDFKENARYEKYKNLSFLAKVYDKAGRLQSKKEGKLDLNLAQPLSPQDDVDGENVLNMDNDLQRNFINILMNHKTPQKHDNNPPSKKRKVERSSTTNTSVKYELGTSLPKPVIVNVEDRVKVENLISINSKHRTSVDNKEATKITLHKIQSPKREQIYSCPFSEDIPPSANNQSIKKNQDKTPQKPLSSQISSFFKASRSSTGNSNDENKINQVTEKNKSHRESHVYQNNISEGITHSIESSKNKVNETKDKHTSNNTSSGESISTNNELDQFFQILKPQIEDFNKEQIMEFFFEMLKPHIKDFDKHKLLDFQIEALQLVRKIQGNPTT